MAGSSVQGVCLIRQPEPAKLEEGNIFYIEYLATAPWNLPNPIARQQYRGLALNFAGHYFICYKYAGFKIRF